MEGIKAKTLFDFLKHLSEDELNSLIIRFKRNMSDGKEEYCIATDIHFVCSDSISFYDGERHLSIEKDIVLNLI